MNIKKVKILIFTALLFCFSSVISFAETAPELDAHIHNEGESFVSDSFNLEEFQQTPLNSDTVLAAAAICTTHTYGPIYLNQPQTCTSLSVQLKTCTKCGYTMSVGTVPALGHSYTVYIGVTCTTAGVQRCVRYSSCGSSITISAQGHAYNVVYVSPTCMEGGINRCIRYSNCGSSVSTNSLGGHNVVNGACTRSGCSYTESVTTPVIPNEVKNKYVLIRDGYYCKLLKYSSLSNGATTTFNDYSALNNFLWKISTRSDGYVYLESAANSSYVLTLMSDNSLKLMLKTDSTTTENQKKWEIITDTIGNFSFKSPYNQRYMHNNNGTATSATSLSPLGTRFVVEKSTDNESTINADFDKYAPPITCLGIDRTEQYIGHEGIDFASGGVNKQAYSVAEGRAYYRQSIGDYQGSPILYGMGNHVFLFDTNDNYGIYYGHFSTFSSRITGYQIINVNEGYGATRRQPINDKKIKERGYITVKRGEFLGLTGTTGMSTGVHLHFEAYYNCTGSSSSDSFTLGTWLSNANDEINYDNKYKLVGGKV